MGTRLSRPSSPSGSEEASGTSLTSTSPQKRAPPLKPPSRFQPRILLVPLSAVLLGSMIFVYSRTTVAAAKENARRAREADGGSISWRREGMRRRGQLEKVEERTLWDQLRGKETEKRERRPVVEDSNPIEEGIRRAREGRTREGKKRGEGE